ncbi:MAG TPA: bacterial transcriptional activator domain-containing protein, partial [Actinomycetota bacterium]
AIASRPLLPGAEGPWVRARREDLVAIAVRAWECLAAAWIRTGDPGQAVRDADRALVVDPYREPALRLMMRALADAGDRAGALRAYERFRRRVADELGADPSPQTQALHVEILRGERSIADA